MEMMNNSNYQYGNMSMPINYYNRNTGYATVTPDNKPNVDKFMHDYNANNREKFNPYWFTRNDDDLIEGMKKVILSCQRDKYFVLKVINFEVIKDYEEINKVLYEYYGSKTKNGKKIDNGYENINLRDSDIMLLRINYYVKLNIPENKLRVDTKTGELDQSEGVVTVLIALPIYVDKYYYRILGNYYIPIFQIVDGSTYNNSTSNSKALTVTLKTQFMPIKVYKEFAIMEDTVTGESVKCVHFASYIFSKKTDAIKFILGRYGIYGALEMLELEGIYFYSVEDKPLDPNVYYNFGDPASMFRVAVIKRLFDKDNVTQSFIYTVIKATKKTTTIQAYYNIFDPRYWAKSLGADFQSATLDKGIPVMDSFESIYDIETKESIRLPEEDKCDSYHILRWIMREFNFLKSRDNIDISNKHPRKADEYLPAIYAKKISTGLYRISDKGKNITFKDVVRVINTSPDYILKSINSANLVDYVDLVNDNDAELALSYTYKGISGLGDQGSGTAVPLIYRSIHPSHLGKVDLDASSNSDPGLSGIICPMANIYDGSFSNFTEPNGWKDFYVSTLNELKSLYGIEQAIEFKKKLGLEYDYIKEDMVRETIENYHRLMPAVIDLNGKYDYSKGAIMSPSIMDNDDSSNIEEANDFISSNISDNMNISEEELPF